MYYVYMISSIKYPSHFYVGYTCDLLKRLEQHNTGLSTYTKVLAPWSLITYVAFSNQQRARKFEDYLKSRAGRAFSKRHF